MTKQLRFDTADAAQEAVDQLNRGKRTKHAVYRVTCEGMPDFFTVGRNALEGRANAAAAMNVRVVVEETQSAIEELLSLPPEKIAELRKLVLAGHLAGFLPEAPK